MHINGRKMKENAVVVEIVTVGSTCKLEEGSQGWENTKLQ